MNKNWIRFARIFLIVNILLTMSAFWFTYENFYLEIAIVSVFLLLSLIARKISYFSVPLSLFFYGSLIFWNVNYIFIFGICFVLGLLIYNLIKSDLGIPKAVYSLIGLFLLLHVIWWNVLPLGFFSDYTLDVGSLDNLDMDDSADLYIVDSGKVLSPIQSYGDKTWREFEKDGSFFVELNTPVNLMNKSVVVLMEYESDSSIYVNDELFYSPLWDDFVKFDGFGGGDEDEEGNLLVDNSVLDEMCFTKFADESGLEFEDKIVDVSFRGSVVFNGIFKNKINVSFIKKDRNWYDGNDTLLFQVVSLDDGDGSEVVFEEIIGDNDGVVAKGVVETTNTSKLFNFEIDNIGYGKYGIIFSDLSDGNDVEVSNIKVNTNKFELVSDFYILSDAMFYFNSNLNSDLGVEFWHKDSGQDIVLSYVNKSGFDVFSLNEDEIKQLKKISLNGYDKLSFEKGDLVFKNYGDSFAFWDNGLIGDFDCDYMKDLGFNFSLDIEEFIEEYFDSSLDVFDSTKSLNISNLNQNNFESYYENFEEFEDVNFEKHVIESSFRGDVCFEGYFGDSIKIEVLKQDLNMYEGYENVILNVTDLDGISVGSFSLPDDGFGNKSSGGDVQEFKFDLPISERGFYDLCFRVVNGSGSDFELINISFNSNKVLSRGYVYIRSPVKVYFDNLDEFSYRYYHNMDQNLIFDDGRIVNVKYDGDLKSKWQGIDVVGLSSMDISDGNLMFDGGRDLYFGYWSDAVFKKSLNPKLVFTLSEDINSSQSLNILIDELKLNLKSQEGAKIYSVGVKNEN